MSALTVDVWSDIACPWCYVGKRRLEAALARFDGRGAVEVRWRAFELDPAAPRILAPPVPYAERLARKYRCSLAEAQEMIRGMTETAARDGLELRFDRIRPGNTFDAHRLLHLAAARGLGDAAQERFLRAYLTEGAPIGEPETLAGLAREVGLEAAEVRELLAGDRLGAEVRADEAAARALGISGVPHFRIGERHALSGAQPAEMLLRALREASSELAATPADGGACGPEDCD